MWDQQYKGRLTFHSTKFNRPVSNEQEDELFTDQVRKIFKSTKWRIQPYVFNMQNWEMVLKLIGQSPAVQFRLNQLGRSTMLKQITHIAFPALQQLDLSRNRIVSIENIQYLHAPCLKRINLSSNLLINISSLRKANFPALYSLDFHSNRIINYKPLTQLKCSKEFISLKIEVFFDEFIKNQDVNWMVKLYPSEMHTLQINSIFRINQTSMLKMINNKYKEIEIQTSNNLQGYHVQQVD